MTPVDFCSKPGSPWRGTVSNIRLIKRVRNMMFCVLLFLLLPVKIISVAQVPEIFSINQWAADCVAKTTCSARQFDDDEISANRFLVNFSCHCDSACHRFGDCCLDVLPGSCGTNQSCVDPIQLEVPSIQPYYSCEHVPEIDPSGGIYLVSKCPEGWTDDFVRSRCEEHFENDTLLNLPVANKRSTDNYRNLFCAICHGEENYLYWKVETCCKNTTTEPDDGDGEVLQICETEYRVPGSNFSYRPCRQSISICPGDYPANEIQQQCELSSTVYVYSKTSTYKNIYCAVCNNVSMEDVYCKQQNAIHVSSMCHGRKRKLPYSFKILLDMNTNLRTKSTRVGIRHIQTSTRNITRRFRCPANKVYDPFIGACRTVWCQSAGSGDWADCRPDKGGDLENSSAEIGASMNCPWIKVNQTEYQLGENGTIFIRAHQKSYQPAEFRLSEGYAFVCVEFTRNYTENQLVNATKIAFNFSDTQVYLSLVGVLLSLIALAVQIIVYALLPTLRNVPGKNLMCLAASLFLAELLFLVAPSLQEVSEEACVTVAVLMHLGFLAAFCWMQVMSFDIWYTFSRKSLHSPSNSKSSAFWFYQAYGWLTPVVVVSAAVIVDNFGPADHALRPRYGQGICWIASRLGLLMFFAGPVAVIVMSNIAFFVLTVRSIIEVDKSTNIVHKNAEKRRFFLYVKLCFLMGVAWAFGFLAAFTAVQALWYLFVILNTLQGMFICVAFVCTKKVLKLLKEKCSCDKPRGTVSSSTGKTSLSTKSTYAVLGKKVQQL